MIANVFIKIGLSLIDIIFDNKRATGDQEDHPVCLFGDIPVDAPLQVGEPALGRMLRGAPHADFVGHENEGGGLPGEFVKLFFQLSEGQFNVRPVVKEKVGCPECHAVDDYHTPFHIVAADFLFLFDVGPLAAALGFVPFYPLAVFLVPYPGGGEVNRLLCPLQRKSLGIIAFPGTLSAGDQDDFFLHSLKI